MNIHLPAILGFTRYQGFDPSPYPRIVLFTIQIIQLIPNFLVTSPRFLVASGDLAEWHDFPDLYKGDWERHGKTHEKHRVVGRCWQLRLAYYRDLIIVTMLPWSLTKNSPALFISFINFRRNIHLPAILL